MACFNVSQNFSTGAFFCVSRLSESNRHCRKSKLRPLDQQLHAGAAGMFCSSDIRYRKPSAKGSGPGLDCCDDSPLPGRCGSSHFLAELHASCAPHVEDGGDAGYRHRPGWPRALLQRPRNPPVTSAHNRGTRASAPGRRPARRRRDAQGRPTPAAAAGSAKPVANLAAAALLRQESNARPHAYP